MVLTQLMAHTSTAAKGPQQHIRAVSSPSLSQDYHGRRNKGQPGDSDGWLVMVGLAISPQPGKQREQEVSQGPVGPVRRGQEGTRQALPASCCQLVFSE